MNIDDGKDGATQRPYVLLPSGNIIDLANSDPNSWNDHDLALGLSRTYRWGGHSAWSRPLSVAQHSLAVLAIREQGSPGLPPGLAFYELLHDAEEGLLGFDCIAPLKALLGAPFAQLCSRLTAAINERYALPELTADEYRLHKTADRIAAASEALHIVGWSMPQIANDLHLSAAPLVLDPLAMLAEEGGFQPWEPWPSEYAGAQWLHRLQHERNRFDPDVRGNLP